MGIALISHASGRDIGSMLSAKYSMAVIKLERRILPNFPKRPLENYDVFFENFSTKGHGLELLEGVEVGNKIIFSISQKSEDLIVRELVQGGDMARFRELFGPVYNSSINNFLEIKWDILVLSEGGLYVPFSIRAYFDIRGADSAASAKLIGYEMWRGALTK